MCRGSLYLHYFFTKQKGHITLSNELTIVNADVGALAEMTDEGASSKFIPSLKITYGVSKHIGEDGSVPGDFFLDGKTIGKEMTVCSLAYRFQCISLTKDGEFVESLVLTKEGKEDIRFKDREELKRFQVANKNNKVDDGFDQLMYIPEINAFGVFFFKKKLAKYSEPVMRSSANGGLVNIKTVKKEWKSYSWYEIQPSQVDGSVELPSNTKDVLKTYLSQAIVEEEEKPAGATKRER